MEKNEVFKIKTSDLVDFKGQYITGDWFPKDEIDQFLGFAEGVSKIDEDTIELTEDPVYFKKDNYIYQVSIYKFIVSCYNHPTNNLEEDSVVEVVDETLAWVTMLYNKFGERYSPYALLALEMHKDKVIDSSNARQKETKLIISQMTDALMFEQDRLFNEVGSIEDMINKITKEKDSLEDGE